MWLRKTRLLPGGAPGGYTWDTDQDVVEVPDDLGADLVAIPDAGFVEVQPPAGADSTKDEPADETPAEVIEAPTAAPKKRAARKPAADTEIAE